MNLKPSLWKAAIFIVLNHQLHWINPKIIKEKQTNKIGFNFSEAKAMTEINHKVILHETNKKTIQKPNANVPKK